MTSATEQRVFIEGREACESLFDQKRAELLHELELIKQVREQVHLLAPRENALAFYSKALMACTAGFDPFRPNPTWKQGFLQAPTPIPGTTHLIFNWPLPQGAIDAHKRAKGLGTFDVYSVHSPISAAFTAVYTPLPAPTAVAVLRDPVLIGWINGTTGNVSGRLKVRAADQALPLLGFLIAAWDLVEDLRPGMG